MMDEAKNAADLQDHIYIMRQEKIRVKTQVTDRRINKHFGASVKKPEQGKNTYFYVLLYTQN